MSMNLGDRKQKQHTSSSSKMGGASSIRPSGSRRRLFISFGCVCLCVRESSFHAPKPKQFSLFCDGEACGCQSVDVRGQFLWISFKHSTFVTVFSSSSRGDESRTLLTNFVECQRNNRSCVSTLDCTGSRVCCLCVLPATFICWLLVNSVPPVDTRVSSFLN